MFERVASEPRVGDEIRFAGGKLSYRVVSLESRTKWYLPFSGGDPVVAVEREEVFNKEPYVRKEQLHVPLSAWRDLAHLACGAAEATLPEPVPA